MYELQEFLPNEQEWKKVDGSGKLSQVFLKNLSSLQSGEIGVETSFSALTIMSVPKLFTNLFPAFKESYKGDEEESMLFDHLTVIVKDGGLLFLGGDRIDLNKTDAIGDDRFSRTEYPYMIRVVEF